MILFMTIIACRAAIPGRLLFGASMLNGFFSHLMAAFI
jgi:hypothetical protein